MQETSNTYVQYGGPYADLIRELVESGRFESPEEVILAGLELLHHEELLRQARIEDMRQKVQEGLEDVKAGRVVPAEEVFKELEARYAMAGKRQP